MQAENPDGLTDDEAAARLETHGPNRLVPQPRHSLAKELLESATEPLQLLLVAVGMLSAIWGQVRDALAIFAVIGVVVVLETLNETHAAKAINALHNLASPKATVRRNGRTTTVDTANVVPDDLLLVKAGDAIAADGRLNTTHGLRVDTSTLTGESMPVIKGPGDPIHAGTAVVGGRGTATVTATGLDTEVGKLGVLVATQREPRTPLQHYMREVAHAALTIAIAVSVLVPLIGLLRGQPAEDMLLAGLTLAFATIPEELPILVSVLLAVGGRRLARKGALVRKLKAAEALGTITVVVTDKTGTLTENRLRLVEIVGDPAATLAAARAAADPEDLDPIDTAIAGDPDPRPVVRTIPFDPETKRATVVRDGQAAMKGAPEHVLQACAANPAHPAALEAAARLAAQGRRVLAVAEGPTEHHLAFVGLLAFEDPIRPGVPEAVATLKAAGVRTLMITGDHPQTANAVARVVGIAPEDVTARATPADKLELVRRLQAAHERVAVTGDGVNDAPALAAADVGIAMGQRGTDLARQAAGVVLTDDAYPTVVAAVEGGRNIRSQLRRAVAFYLGAKVALVATIAASLVLGHAAAFAPVHVVLLELFMDLGASLAFVAEPPAPGLLRRPPPTPTIRFLDRHESAAIALVGLALAAGSLVAYLMANADAANNPRDTAVATWLIGHVLVAWALRARPTTPPAHNPLFLAWVAAAAITVAATLAPDPTPLAIGVLISTVLAFAGGRLLRLGAAL